MHEDQTGGNSDATASSKELIRAPREIERLRYQVAKFEDEFNGVDVKLAEGATFTTSASTSTYNSTPESIPTPSKSSIGIKSPIQPPQHLSASDIDAHSTPSWEGIHVATARSDRALHYGPFSTAYFVSRVGAYLASELQPPIIDRTMNLYGTSSMTTSRLAMPSDLTPISTSGGHFLSRSQEEYFVSLFWESYNCTLPIIDEKAFREHYSALWADPTRSQRRPSPLVDIILALCMQYGMGFLPRTTSATSANSEPKAHLEDAQVAGRSYYRRCQALLAPEMESPTLASVQCYLFSAVYLCLASFQNMAYSTLALAIRTAHSLGLYLEAPATLSLGDRELRKRIWWTAITIEAKMSLKLGRPSLAPETGNQAAQLPCPADDPKTVSLAGGRLGSYGPDISWITFTVQSQRLVSAASTTSRLLYDTSGHVLQHKGIQSLYAHPDAMDTCAEVLSSRMGPRLLQEWVSQVPAGMKIARCSPSSLPFSTDRTPLQIDYNAPTWLQRQQLLLELTYHMLCTSLCRPFITFSSPNSRKAYAPFSEKRTGVAVERYALSSVKHAIAHTHIMHQALSESDVLNSWLECFQWQWNATVTMIGFVLAYPMGPSTLGARTAIDKSIEIFQIFKDSYAVAEGAVKLTADMAAKVDAVLNKFRTGLTGPADDPVSPRHDDIVVDHEGGQNTVVMDDMAESQFYAEFIDSVLSVDSFNSFEDFYGDELNFVGL
ncbi:uncharacterized protein DNG_09955 [Cephalotrichum gorgonifer]|uniref:Xylanolytic transcriptional activator regulatory domain-containing protein n=1 Tax=Cephalotrichum gorgonifer TaxID=2041049 RepID=A0AAE8SZS4_9PEZI|nr:uncharacterized protein DNG_09955 [Cephalotrichum gorgonifer]